MGINAHKKLAPQELKIGIITISTTRTPADDKSGRWISKQVRKQRHEVVFYQVIPDQVSHIAETVVDVIDSFSPHVLLLTGGTGISSKDVTIEAVKPLFAKELTSFGPLFAQLSFEEIDSAAILSRATAGIINKTIIFCLPGSLKACKLGCKFLIFPELGHLMFHVHEG